MKFVWIKKLLKYKDLSFRVVSVIEMTLYAKMLTPDLQRHRSLLIETLIKMWLKYRGFYELKSVVDNFSVVSYKQEMCNSLLQWTHKWKQFKYRVSNETWQLVNGFECLLPYIILDIKDFFQFISLTHSFTQIYFTFEINFL